MLTFSTDCIFQYFVIHVFHETLKSLKHIQINAHSGLDLISFMINELQD